MAYETAGGARRAAAHKAAERYAAFISYSHADEEIADWLHRKLESYRVPKGLPAANRKQRLGKVFRDRVELATSHDLSGDIRAALDRSDALILLCSPRAARSQYVSEEIRRFKETGKGAQIFPIILAGEPHAAGKPGRTADEECFPRALIYQVDETGTLTDQPETVEPIAADVREGKDGRENGALKLIAGLLGAGLDDLVQREKQSERRRRFRANAIAGIMTILALGAVAGGAIAFWQGGIAQTQRAEAEKQTATALRRTSDMLARESRLIAQDNDYHAALLMALQADPLARRSDITRKFDGERGYPLALARLAAAYANLRSSLAINAAPETVEAAIFSPNGEQIAISSFEGKLRIRDAASGALLKTLEGHEATIRSADYSADGAQIVTASGDKTARIWDVKTGTVIHILREGAMLNSAVFSADGKRVLTSLMDGSATLWEPKTGVALRTFKGEKETLAPAVFSHDSAQVLTAHNDGSIAIWSAETGKRLKVIKAHNSAVANAVFSPDDTLIATGSYDGAARIWNAATGELITTVLNEGDVMQTVAFAPKPDARGTLLVTASPDTEAIVWDLDSGMKVAVLKAHKSGFISAAFSPDGRRILTASYEKVVVWDIGSGQAGDPIYNHPEDGGAKDYGPLSQEDGAVVAVDYGPPLRDTASSLIAGASDDGVARIWNVDSGALISSFEGHAKAVNSIAFSPDGARVVTASSDKTAQVWNPLTGAAVLTLSGHTGALSWAAFSPDGRRIVTTSYDKTARIWDAQTGNTMVTLPKQKREYYSAAFAPDGQRIVTSNGSADTIQTWNATTGDLGLTLSGHTNSVRSVAFSPDGKRILSASDDKTARVWDATTGEVLLTLSGHSGFVWSAAYSTDGAFIVTGGDDGTARVWDAVTGENLLVLTGHTGWVLGVHFSPDGQRIVTGSDDGTVRRWNIPTILRADHEEQARMACDRLWRAQAPLAFTKADAQRYPVLQGEPIDPATGEFVSPCKGILPDEAFANSTLVAPS